MDIVIASNNKGKIKEYLELFNDCNFNILSLSDLNITLNVNEKYKTFKGNSKLKALEVNKYTNLDIISDDSGLVIKSLKGILGTRSARFLGDNVDYVTRCNEILKRLENKKRDAYFKTVITLIHKGKIKQFKGKINGKISSKISGNNGFGYDIIFIPKGYDKTFADLDESIKNSISHRAIAFKKLLKYVRKNYEYFVN